MNEQLQIDLGEFVNQFPYLERLKAKTFLITGATGLIGSTLIHCLLYLNKDIKILAPVRSLQRAKHLFDEAELLNIRLLEYEIESYDYGSISNVDYIVHCAAPTSSRFFVDYPVETFNTIYQGTYRLLEFARKTSIKGFVFLSSLEVYGDICDDSIALREDKQGPLDILAVRSSYPMAKRAAENLCVSYCQEYGVPVSIARLTQTTGVGVSVDDNRVITQFARLVFNGDDIVLHSTGESARPYCYTIDAISAILILLLNGKPGEAYNIANEKTYISAKEMAYFLKSYTRNAIDVKIDVDKSFGYAPMSKLRLSSKKMRDLGWTPQYNIERIFSRLFSYFGSL